MATFGEFTVARLGMIASQMALNVTGQNISNINTPGYTRQQLDQYSFITNGSGLYHSNSSASVGSGVLLAGISQLRDPYLDIRFRKEMSSVGSTDATLNVLDQLQSVINNVDKEGIVTQLQDLLQNINDLSSKVGQQEFETLVRQSAQDLCTLLNASASKLQQVYDNILQQYNEDIQDTNNILEKIQDLNEQIRIADINGDAALELRDQRNTLIDSLSETMKIDVTYGKEDVGAGFTVEKLTIKMVDATTGKPGKTLIDGISRAELETVEGDPNMFLNISELRDPDGVQTSNTNSLFNLSGLTFDDQTAGGYKSILVKYTDDKGQSQEAKIQFEVVKPTNPDDKDSVEAARQTTLANLQKALQDQFKDQFTVSTTATGINMVSKQTGADAFNITSMEVQTSAISFNGQSSRPAVESNVTTITNGMGYGSLESTRQMLVGAGEFSTDEAYSSIRGIPYYMRSLDMLANKIATEMNRVNTTDTNGNSIIGTIEGAGNLFVAEGDDPSNPSKLITAANISVSEKWQNGETSIVASTKPNAQTTDNDNINRFYNILNAVYDYRATDIVRQDQTPFTSGALKQTGGAGVDLEAKITYIDEMNQEHTVPIKFQSGANAAETLDHLQAAIAKEPNLKDFTLSVSQTDGTITMTDMGAYSANGGVCNLVTDIQITDDQGAATDAFQMGIGKIGGTVTSGKIYQGNLESSYSNMEAVLGTHINTTSTIYETYATSADEINTSRDSVSGVDLNDEGINLLQYQKSFAAACRLMTALDEAMDKVINGMGVVGR